MKLDTHSNKQFFVCRRKTKTKTPEKSFVSLNPESKINFKYCSSVCGPGNLKHLLICLYISEEIKIFIDREAEIF